MSFRFVHTADIHLDSPLKSLALRNPSLADIVANATRQAFVRIIDLCLRESVDALLIAGDLYDGDQTSMKTARFFAEQLHRLDAAGIRTFILRGNHDALSRITRELSFPDTVTTFGGRAEAVALDRGGVLPDIVIHGLSFANPKAPEGLLPKYKPPVAKAVNIGLMHTSLNGAPGHDPYAPCTVADLDASGFHYWALGHIHKRSVNIGRATIVMPGNPQGRDINEAGLKSVSLATIAEDGSISLEEHAVSIAQFERLTVDIAGIADWRDLVSATVSALKALRREVATEHLIIRLHLTGASSLAWTIRRDMDLLEQEVGMHAEMTGSVWIEKIDLQLDFAPVNDADSSDTLSELHKLMLNDVGRGEGFRSQMDEHASDLIRALPTELRNLLGRDESEREACLASLLHEGADEVLARLSSPVAGTAR
ncbi:calcineurin-like phosphoesterase family protein [Asticcacaulis biprosthecium C19]|uniref:Calcineurin-like phosphoesterase family protein n=1 Tax=Asticcacaulis biprosthecium C19 TaxID=715226 RepID=F4QHH0_9CAUL|nr:DNA repair exonuclease [Asticcacaulis biprosthecium]EGF92707.1 calcineurin-like phosphoesterase family protein [Asticcacaulis biprosthecium C19]